MQGRASKGITSQSEEVIPALVLVPSLPGKDFNLGGCFTVHLCSTRQSCSHRERTLAWASSRIELAPKEVVLSSSYRTITVFHLPGNPCFPLVVEVWAFLFKKTPFVFLSESLKKSKSVIGKTM